MSEQTVLLPNIQYHVEKIVEEVARKGVAELELHIEVNVDKGRYGLWLKVKPT